MSTSSSSASVNSVSSANCGKSARPENGSLDTLGLYEGTAITERDTYGFGELPDRIILFREPLIAVCDDLDELRDQIHVTLVHEIAHYYGIDDAQLHELGWD